MTACPMTHEHLTAKKNGDFRTSAANKKLKQQTSLCLLQTEMENKSLFSLVGKR
jgi:hypothetical protein